MPDGTRELSIHDVKKVAALSRLALTPEQMESCRTQMSAVLAHMDALRALDLTAVEPMAYPSDAPGRMDDDTPREPFPPSVLSQMAPDAAPPFLKIPKVLSDGGGA